MRARLPLDEQQRSFKENSPRDDDWHAEAYEEEYDRMPQRYRQARDIQMTFVLSAARTTSFVPSIILDLGCGTARQGMDVLSGSRNTFYLGLDRSEAMLKYAARKLSGFAASARWKLVKADFGTVTPECIGAALESYHSLDQVTAVMSAFALHHLDPRTKRNVIELIRSVLPDGGRFVYADLFTNSIEECSRRALETELNDLRQFEWADDGGRWHGRLPPTLCERHYINENKPLPLQQEIDLLHLSGFATVDIVCREGQLAVLVAE